MTNMLVLTSWFAVSHLFLPFFSLSKFKTPLISPTSTSAHHLYSIFMSVSLRKKQPLAVNWPISHISFPKLEAGRGDVHSGRTVNSLVSPGPWNESIRVFFSNQPQILFSFIAFRCKPFGICSQTSSVPVIKWNRSRQLTRSVLQAHQAQWFPKWRKISEHFHYSADV